MDRGSVVLPPEKWRFLMDATIRPAAQVPLAVVGGTGLWMTEFLHLHEDWIEWPSKRPDDPSVPIIRIPENEECRRKKVPQGHSIDVEVTEQDQPCHTCRMNSESSDKLQPEFRSPRGKDVPQVIPVVDEDAANVLDWWFNQHDTIPWNHQYTALNTEVTEHLDRSARVNHTSLRRTFVARAAEMNLDLSLIADSLGVECRQLKQEGAPFTVVAEQFGDYKQHVSQTQRTTQRTFQDYLMAVHKVSPASQRKIADALGLTYSAVCCRMKSLEKDDFVKKVEETDRGGPIWEAIVPPGTELECRHDHCEESFDTKKGRSIHETRTHNN